MLGDQFIPYTYYDFSVDGLNSSGGPSNGTYTLISGNLNTASTTVGNDGTGTFDQSGGTHTVATTLSVGANSTGTYNLAGGDLSAASVDNKGTINYSAGSVALGGGTGTLTNNVDGTVNFSGTGTRVVNGNLTNSGAVILTADAQVNVLANTGGTIALGTNNLIVTKDYTNAGFGTGNSFNKLSGLSGTGQIVGQDADQTITGAVTSTGTNSYTLDIGNVRGGTSKDVNYQIANSRGTGADIRGAIQTNSIDTRLSGAGVTADNFGPIIAGSNSGNNSVTFNASSGGAIGGHLNVVSNFGNVATDTITFNGMASALAVGNATPDTALNLGNFHVGAGVNPIQNFDVTNSTSGSGAEQLGIASAVTTGHFAATNNLGTGLITGGAASANGVTAQVSGGVAGFNSGYVAIQYLTDGTNIDAGFTSQNANSQNISLNATGYNLAVGIVTTGPVTIANQHVGGSLTEALTVSNTAPTDATYTETLSASFGSNTGNATNNGTSVSGIAGGGNDSSAMLVGVDTSAAGARTGTVTVNMTSSEANGSGLGNTTLAPQTVNVSGNVYRLAAANVLGNVNFGNVHVGDTVQQALNITNTAANDGFSENLNASFGASSDGRITTSSSINQLAAGASNSTSMVLGLITSAAGKVNGTQTVNFYSDGSGTSGLGLTALAAQTIGVSGDITTNGSVFRLASASQATLNPVDFGNVRINTFADQVLSISNTAANDGFSEGLNASISTNGAPVTASGAFNLLAAESTDNSSLHVGLNTSTGGAKSGSATIALVSDGTGTSGLGTTNLAPQTVNVSGNVYRLANPTLNTSSVTLAARVGDAVSANQAVSITNTSPDIYTEGLKVNVAGISGNAQSNSGSIANLAAQGTNNSAIQVGLGSTAVAGATTGQVTLNLDSTGAGTTGATDFSIGTTVVDVVGKVYQQAVALVNTAAVNFGIVHVGDAASKQVTVQNGASSTMLNDVLGGTLAVSGQGITGGGSINANGLAAGATQDFTVGLVTATAGEFTGNATFAGVSHNADMADLDLKSVSATISGQVNNYAVAQLLQGSGDGTWAQSGSTYTLDFGTFTQNSGIFNASVSAANGASGVYSDWLSGGFSSSDFIDFGETVFNFDQLLAGISTPDALSFTFNTADIGYFSDTIVLHSFGGNANYSAALNDITLTVSGRVNPNGTQPVPEPGTMLLFGTGLACLAGIARRRRN